MYGNYAGCMYSIRSFSADTHNPAQRNERIGDGADARVRSFYPTTKAVLQMRIKRLAMRGNNSAMAYPLQECLKKLKTKRVTGTEEGGI
jgi:hypothetical protein